MASMRMLGPAGYPANRAAGRWVFDALVALLAGASALPDLFHNATHTRPACGDRRAGLDGGTAAGPPDLAHPGVRLGRGHRHPRRLWDRHLIDGLALLITLYTVAALRPRRAALACAGVLELVVVIGLVSFAGGDWWYDAIFLSGMIAAALGLGLYSAARRAYLAELHDRAERLEREKDQQAALAAAAERARIAREMHDIVAHHLTVMTTLAEAAIAASASSPERATDVMRNVAATGRRALADTRKLLGVLRQRPGQDPGDALQPVPDLAQLDTLIEQVRSAGLDTTLEVHGQARTCPPACS